MTPNDPTSSIDAESLPEPEPEPALSRRALANRRNAQKSTGPWSAEGKQRSRRNAWKHGLRAEAVVDEADLKAVEEAVVRYGESIRPECFVEAELVRSAAVAAVRKRGSRVCFSSIAHVT